MVNVAYFVIWAPVVHRQFAPRLHIKWLLQDIFKAIVLPLSVSVAIMYLMPVNSGRTRVGEGVVLSALGLLLLFLSMLSTSEIRAKI